MGHPASGIVWSTSNNQFVSGKCIYKTVTMRMDSRIHSHQRARSVSCQLENGKLSTPYLITASSSSFLTTAAISASSLVTTTTTWSPSLVTKTATSSPSLMTTTPISPLYTPVSSLTFRRTSTRVFQETDPTKMAEVSNSSKLLSSRTTHSTRNRSLNNLAKRWVSPLTTPRDRTRQKPLASVSLRGAIRTNSSSLASQPVPDCNNSNSTTRDFQKSFSTSEPRDLGPATNGNVLIEDNEGGMGEVTEEQIERERNIEKCLNWIANLPDKFSGMYILHERAPVIVD